MARKINSEYVVDNDNFKVKIGTTDKKNPKTVYIDCGFFIEPKVEKEDYSEDIKLVEEEARNLAKKISNATNPKTVDRLFKKDFIFVFEVTENRIFYGKKSYVSFQLHLRQNDDTLEWVTISEHLLHLSDFMTTILLRNIEDIGFEVTKTKK